MKKENGFSLVELIVALGIGSLVLVAIYSFLNMSQRSSSGIEKRVAAQQDARSALELMATEIQMASYNPGSDKNIWINSPGCYGATNQDYRGIHEATATSIAIEMDINGDGSIGDDNETISYAYDTTNKRITREINCGGAEAFLGSTSANTKTVSVENNAAGIPVFRYFNGFGVEITSPVTGQIPYIRRVEITLVVDTPTSDVAGPNTRRRIIYSTSVILRNHFALNYN